MKTQGGNPQTIPQLIVRGRSPGAQTGTLSFGGRRLPCALGRSGRRVVKREGDGATPIGSFAVREAFYRADRLARPRTALPLRPIDVLDGWCDDPLDRNYNRRVRHPYPVSAERLWRSDHLYDLVVVLGYNDRPRIAGRGSAIFMHVAGSGFAPTAGCIALRLPDLKRLLEEVPRGAVVTVTA